MKERFDKKAAAALICCCMLLGCSDGNSGNEEKYVSENIYETQYSEDISAVTRAPADSVNDADDEACRADGKLLECRFYDEKTFFIQDRISAPYDIDGKLTSGVVTHHLLAGKMIAGFFKTAAANRGDDIETVVITAPMHYPELRKNDSLFCTSLLGWQTPYGTAAADTDFSERFISELGAEENDRMLSYDHSASSLLPYIKYYLPEARVSCLLVSEHSGNFPAEKISELFGKMSEEKNCLFVFSIDFSHYLSPEESETMDEITLEAVMSRDLEKISAMTDSNLDSPRCMCTFLNFVGSTGGNVVRLDHGNSLSVSDLPYTKSALGNGVTSYFVFGGTVN